VVCTPGQKIASSFLEWAIMYRQICFDLNGYTLGLIGMASGGCEYWVDLLIVVCFDKVGGTFSFFFSFDNKWLQFWVSAFMIMDCIRRMDNMA
jgi:hypothetical protein